MRCSACRRSNWPKPSRPTRPTWLYEFHKASTAFGGSMGAAHAVEVPFVFDNLGAPGAKFITGEPTRRWTSLATRDGRRLDDLRPHRRPERHVVAGVAPLLARRPSHDDPR